MTEMFGNQAADFWVETGERPLLANSSNSMHPVERGKHVDLWRQAAFYAAAEAGVPKGLDRVAFVARPHYNKGPLPDTGGISPTLKAVIDGLVDYGLIPDDNGDHSRAEVLMAPHLNRLLPHPRVHIGVYDLAM